MLRLDLLARPTPTPKARRVVIAATRQKMAKGMPLQTPYIRFVRRCHDMDRRLGYRGAQGPVQNRAVRATRHEQVIVNGVPFHCAHFLAVTLECVQLGHRTYIVQLDRLVTRCCRDNMTVRIPPHGLHRVLVAMERAQVHPRARVPEFDEVVFATRYKQGLRRVPLHALDFPSMALQRRFLLCLVERPDLESAVIRGRHESLVVRRKAQTADRVAVPWERLQIVHIHQKVLDLPVLVRRYEPRACVRPFHRAHGRVVRLQDRLKVKSQAIPQRKLAAC